jgi:hypothetical protein
MLVNVGIFKNLTKLNILKNSRATKSYKKLQKATKLKNIKMFTNVHKFKN